MKNKIALGSASVISILIFHPASLRAQGSLTPPGPPAATMKSLDQIEARTPISAAPFVISKPGSYYLTANLNVTNGDGVDINTNQVTLDLNGFTISSTAPSANGTGIYLAMMNEIDITVLNGHIKGGVTNHAGAFAGPGFNNGLFYNGNPTVGAPYNVRISGVSVSGCLNNGINLGEYYSSDVEFCLVNSVGGDGIVADSVSHCTAQVCGGYGIFAVTASDSRGDTVSDGTGFYATTANNCHGVSTGAGTGLYIAGVANGCYGECDSGVGMIAHIANSCMVGGGTTNITFKYNMP